MKSILTTTIALTCAMAFSFSILPAAAQNKKPAFCQAKSFGVLLKSINKGKVAKVHPSTVAAANYLYASAKKLRAQKRPRLCERALKVGNALMTTAAVIHQVGNKPRKAVVRPGTLHSGITRIGKAKILAKASKIKHGQSFGYSFWIRPLKAAPDWTAIFHKGSKNFQRGPAVFMFPKSTRLHVRMGTKGKPNDGCNAKAQLAVNKWSHVYLQFSPGTAWIYVNGKGNNRCKIGNKLTLNKAPLYLGSPWNKPSIANMGTLRVHNGRLTIQQIRQVMKNQL